MFLRTLCCLLYLGLFLGACDRSKTDHVLSLSVVKEHNLAGYWGDSTGQLLLIITDSAEIHVFSHHLNSCLMSAKANKAVVWADSTAFLQQCNNCGDADFQDKPKLHLQGKTISVSYGDWQKKQFWRYAIDTSKFSSNAEVSKITEPLDFFRDRHWRVSIKDEPAHLQLFLDEQAVSAYRIVQKSLFRPDTIFYSDTKYAGSMEGYASIFVSRFLGDRYSCVQIIPLETLNYKVYAGRTFLLAASNKKEYSGIELLGKGLSHSVVFAVNPDTILERGHKLFNEVYRARPIPLEPEQRAAYQKEQMKFVEMLNKLDYVYMPLAW